MEKFVAITRKKRKKTVKPESEAAGMVCRRLQRSCKSGHGTEDNEFSGQKAEVHF